MRHSFGFLDVLFAKKYEIRRRGDGYVCYSSNGRPVPELSVTEYDSFFTTRYKVRLFATRLDALMALIEVAYDMGWKTICVDSDFYGVVGKDSFIQF